MKIQKNLLWTNSKYFQTKDKFLSEKHSYKHSCLSRIFEQIVLKKGFHKISFRVFPRIFVFFTHHASKLFSSIQADNVFVFKYSRRKWPITQSRNPYQSAFLARQSNPCITSRKNVLLQYFKLAHERSGSPHIWGYLYRCY